MLKTEAISEFLKANTHPDLAAFYNYNMEVQVNVLQGDGERVEGEYKGRRWVGWTNGNLTWKSFRIPYNAGKDPTYEDSPIRWPLEDYAEGIGMTGWDWVNKVSKWVAFDFDAIVGHSSSHDRKLTEVELKQVKDAVSKIPWVTVRRSTSGSGLHLYVKLDNIETENHHEHAALARAILGKMTVLAGFDFESKVDICGHNMWVWHRKMKGTQGLTVIKRGVTLDEPPPNWQDHISVVRNRNGKARPASAPGQSFDELTAQSSNVPLEPEHLNLIEYLEEKGAFYWWNQDYHLLVCHTYDLKCAHNDLGLKGIFDTIAKGSEQGADHNCFCYPLRRGGWIVRRFSPGVSESNCWDQDAKGFTRCYLNVEPTLRTACRQYGGLELEDGSFTFNNFEDAVAAARALGADVVKPQYIPPSRACVIKMSKTKKLIFTFEAAEADTQDPDISKKWAKNKNKKNWTKVLNVKDTIESDMDLENLDDMVRHLVTPDGHNLDWALQSDGVWRFEPLSHVKSFLKAQGYAANRIDPLIGSCIEKAWTVIHRPFVPEYPGDRKWNHNSVQLKFSPSDSEDLNFPHWRRILQHVGDTLTDAVEENSWCRKNGLKTGEDYLACWIASIFQQPEEPLPYLFLFGGQNSGKSIFHEAIDLLVTKGVVRADHALTSSSGFNFELEGSILCVIEETDLGGQASKTVINRVKDWVTSRKINIRKMYNAPYLTKNTTHWVQCSNDQNACPVFPGDTRIVVCYVPDLQNVIPKRELIQKLEKEAPDFLRHILDIELPTPDDRLNIPCLYTAEKVKLQEMNQNPVLEFLKEHTKNAPGYSISYANLWEKFRKHFNHPNWGKRRMGDAMPPEYPKGRMASDGNNIHFGNIAFNEDDTSEKRKYLKNKKKGNEVWLEPTGE